MANFLPRFRADLESVYCKTWKGTFHISIFNAFIENSHEYKIEGLSERTYEKCYSATISSNCTYNEQLVSTLIQFFVLEFKMTQYIKWYIPFENHALVQDPFLD